MDQNRTLATSAELSSQRGILYNVGYFLIVLYFTESYAAPRNTHKRKQASNNALKHSTKLKLALSKAYSVVVYLKV